MPIPGNTSSEGKKPTIPTIGTASAGNTSASVQYTASTYQGKGTVTYYATSSPGNIQASGPSPINVTGLTNGTSYSFVVKAVTNYGVSSDNSASSNSVVPVAPPPSFTPPPPSFTPPPPSFTPPPPSFTPPPPSFTPPPPSFTPVYTAFRCSSQDVIDGYCSFVNQCSGSANTGYSCTCSPSNIPC